MGTQLELCPFLEIHQLNKQLHFGSIGTWGRLRRTDNNPNTLPGQPRVQLETDALREYLKAELLTPELDRLAPKLWLIATPRSSHISPLHHQAVRGRAITLTESPQLHLVWYYDQIFIKPIPKYLLSFAFWQYLEHESAELKEAAVGFMRTYTYLLRYESDFNIAKEKGLIPQNEALEDGEDLITWDGLAKLVSFFDSFGDEAVSPRYGYGELRLTRLNFFARIFLRKLTYHHINAQWGPFFNGFFTPFIVVFAFMTLILNAMQVQLAVQAIDNIDPRWVTFVHFSEAFVVIALVFTAFIVGLAVLIMGTMFVHDQWFAQRICRQKKKDPSGHSWKQKKSGVI